MSKHLKATSNPLPAELAAELVNFFSKVDNKSIMNLYNKTKWTLDGESLGGLFNLMAIAITHRGKWLAQDNILIDKIIQNIPHQPTPRP